MIKFYIIAGEASGDLHGSNLVSAIKKLAPETDFRGFGGPQMAAAGVHITQDYRQIAFMGFREVLTNFYRIKRALKKCKEDIKNYQPETLILIDYPGFNLRIARFAKKLKLNVIYYISPQLWAWNEKRVNQIHAYVDRMICILPFEKEFYQRHGIEAFYAGHPLKAHIDNYKQEPGPSPVSQPFIAVLPGSRKQEIIQILPTITKLPDYFPQYQFVVACTPAFSESFYRELLSDNRFLLLFDQTYDILYHARAGIITSGTATLEAALLGLPIVVVYKTSKLNYSIFKRLVKVKYISLINLIADRQVVKELIQEYCNETELIKELIKICEVGPYRKELESGYANIAEKLGTKDASIETAKHILDFINRK